jgi:hypothetical protein
MDFGEIGAMLATRSQGLSKDAAANRSTPGMPLNYAAL